MSRQSPLAIHRLAVILVLFLSACSLQKASTGGPFPGATGVATNPPSLSSLRGGFAVQIVKPATGARFPAGQPVQVDFVAAGGPFIEFDLLVDNVNVASQPATSGDARVKGSFQWDPQAAGAHTLKVEALDANKNIAAAEVQVQIGDVETPANGNPTGTAVQPAASGGGMQLRFVNLTDGGTVQASMVKASDGTLKPLVVVQVEVSGASALDVSFQVNGLDLMDENDRVESLTNPTGSTPFRGEVHWSPINGGGEYTLVATALSGDKSGSVQATVHVTVSGVAAFTPTPPPLDQASARRRFTQLYQQLYGVNIPDPSIQRFDFPNLPNRSRWISAVYYKGWRYYIELFDDSHYDLSPLPYADPIHPSNKDVFTICRPAGQYKILVVFVDYGNLALNQAEVRQETQSISAWTNQLYDNFAVSQGFASSPLHIQTDSVWIAPPPSPGNLLTLAQIRSATGTDPSQYDFIMEIDLDKNDTVGKTVFQGVLESNVGGVALQGCGPRTKYDVNIWSGVSDTGSMQGDLEMDFDHELSHLFGMMDSWPFSPGSVLAPDGLRHDDWIPYVMFGWTDTDGDHLPEIIDPTPYGSAGPQP